MNPTLRRWLTHPGFLFALAWAALLALLFAPLLAGGVLVNPMSDGKDGYVTRHFAAEVIRTWGEVPRWNPYIFGGMPFLGAMHGDQVYPISVALRAVFAPALAIGLGMVFHCWLAATGMLAFLKRQGLSWSAAITGATAYGVSGPLLSLFYPGHDGKIYVLGLTPWALLAIYEACRTRKPMLFALWGLLVGLMLLSPHFQMTYYSSLLMGAFIFFCLFTETPKASRLWVLGGFGIASVLALMTAAAQLMPFAEYLPFSPRSASGSSSTGWEYATSWAMPAIELVGTMWGGFNGWLETYWGTNAFKLHSDYIGLLVGVLAITALIRTPAGKERRRAMFWGIAVVFGTLWVLAGQTPFYRIPYHLFPMISKTRAASMMWGHVALCFGVLAGLGLQQWELMKDDVRAVWAKRIAMGAVVAAGLMLASAEGLITSLAVAQRADAAFASVAGARIGLLLGAMTVMVFVVTAWRAPRMLGIAAVTMLLLDLGVQARRFIRIEPAGDAFFAADEVVQAIQRDAAGLTQPWRVLPALWLGERSVYMDDYLQEHRIRNVFGYHGNELHTYDELLGGKNQWRYITQPQAWRLTATRYLLVNGPVGEVPPGFVVVGTGLRTWLGEEASVVRLTDAAPWAVISPGALKVADDAQVNATAMNPQFDPARLTLVPGDAPFGVTTAPTGMPPAISPAPQITVTERQPGVYVLAIDSLVQDGVLVVSENYVPWWKATVDGAETPVARANGTFVAVQVPRGAKEVVLSVDSPADRRGLLVSFLGLAGIVLFSLTGLLMRRGSTTEPAAA